MSIERYIGYWRRGKSQYWHITEKGACLINTAEIGKHYDGDAHIFFKPTDTTIYTHEGRVLITKADFDKAKRQHIKRLNQF